jgi:hypothetical protein
MKIILSRHVNQQTLRDKYFWGFTHLPSFGVGCHAKKIKVKSYNFLLSHSFSEWNGKKMFLEGDGESEGEGKEALYACFEIV